MKRCCSISIAIAMSACGGPTDVYTFAHSRESTEGRSFTSFAVTGGRIVLGFTPANAGMGGLSLYENGMEHPLVMGIASYLSTLYAANGHAYYRAQDDQLIQSVSLDGGAPVPLADPGEKDCFIQGSTSDALLINCDQHGFRLPFSGEPAVPLYKGDFIYPVPVGDHVDFVDPSRSDCTVHSTVKSAPLAGNGDATVLWPPPGGERILTGMVALNGSLLVAVQNDYNSDLYLMPEGGSSSPPQIASIKGLGGLVSDGTRAFAISIPGILSNKLFATIEAIDASGSKSDAVGHRGYIRDLALDGKTIYWIEDSGDATVVYLRSSGI
jgi:hypothetical protein